MAHSGLTTHDLKVLEKIKDPESAPSVPVLIDPGLPRDPYLTQSTEYEQAAASERQIVREFQILEARIAVLNVENHSALAEILRDYDTCTDKLRSLVTSYPKYASAHNNYAQALRRRHGESVLLRVSHPLPGLTSTDNPVNEIIDIAAFTILRSLDTAIFLLSPLIPFASISPQAAKTLSQAHTQRGALYHITARQLNSDPEARLRIDKNYTAVDLEEMASQDFMLGGRYGNEIARGLAVATNPTAKLCGSIVQEAMRKEFGSSIAGNHNAGTGYHGVW